MPPPRGWPFIIMLKVHFSFRAALLAVCLVCAPVSPAEESLSPSTPTTNTPPTPDADAVKELLGESSDLLARGNLDDALRKVDTALQIDPRNILAYTLRASIYAQEKLWDRAEQDYQTAYKISPSEVVFKYDMAEIHFMQKAYDAARPGFAALQNDKRVGNIATYKVFLCDLFNRNNDAAAKDLAAIKKAGESPAYYYGNVFWFWAHQQKPEANKWLTSALQLYDSHIHQLYFINIVDEGIEAPTVTFLAKSGVLYDKVKASIDSDGLRILNPEVGWSTIPFEQLPDDLSVFPPELRKQIATRRDLSPYAPSKVNRTSFTTKQGNHYDQVQVFMESTGLSVLTPDGWLTIPFKQLPDDLSPFPKEMQKEIAEKRRTAAPATPDNELLSFTTKQGKHYDEVRASVEDTGLSVLTPDGWLIIPFKQLPDDLSEFPAEMQKQIEEKRLTAPNNALSTTLFSFTTKLGTYYSQVRVSVENDGLDVLTPDGWFTVPFKQLPDDLSVFPTELRKQIEAIQQNQEAEAKIKQAASLSKTKSPIPNSTSGGTKPHDVGGIDPEQTDLSPEGAKDCLFGSCIAIEGSTMVVGGNGATYVYENGQLKTRLCPDADATHTGDQVNSVSISNNTIAIGTRKGIYVWVGTPKGWKLQAHLFSLNPTTVVLDHDQMVVGTNGKGISSGSVSYYARKGETWELVPGNSGQNRAAYSADLYGHIVALKNQWALVGSPNWSTASYEGIGPLYSGRAFVEKYNGSIWREETQLTPDDNGIGANQFGGSVALSDDFIAISSSNHDHIDYAPHHGMVYVFQRDIDVWKEEALIKSPNPSNDEGFGNAPIVLSQHTLAIGDPLVNVDVPDVVSMAGEKSGKPGTIKKAGAVYVYENQVLQATLLAPDPVDGLNHLGSPDQYTCSLAISGDTLAVGARGKDHGTGAVYVWKRQNHQWHLDTELKGFHPQSDFHD